MGDDTPMAVSSSRAARRSKDSSKTRVQPVFEELLSRDPTGAGWLSNLLSLPTQGEGARSPGPPTRVGALDDGCGWKFEARLEPPLSLLRWLIENPTHTPPRDYGTRSQNVKENRELLCAGDEETRRSALELLASTGFRERAWYVFEGKTAVDMLMKTETLIVLIEGKRTEPRPTTSTIWMAVREQMLRNIDAAWDNRGDRNIVGFYIVGDDASTSLSSTWTRAVDNTVSAAMLNGSLPHRSRTERDEIAQSFIGATTWGRVCAELGIDYGSLPDVL
jgi:hypothetical protein